MMRAEQWSLLRTKTDETVDDTDWVGTNAAPDVAICAQMPSCSSQIARPYTGVEVYVMATDASRVPVNRATMTVDLTLIEVVEREAPLLGGTTGDADAVLDSAVELAVPPQRVVYFPINGTPQFTVRVTNDANAVGTQLQVWWRAVAR